MIKVNKEFYLPLGKILYSKRILQLIIYHSLQGLDFDKKIVQGVEWHIMAKMPNDGDYIFNHPDGDGLRICEHEMFYIPKEYFVNPQGLIIINKKVKKVTFDRSGFIDNEKSELEHLVWRAYAEYNHAEV